MEYTEDRRKPNPEKAAGRRLRTLLIIVLVSIIMSLTGIVLYIVLPPLRGIILLFVIAALVAYLLEPVVTWMENYGVKRAYSIILLYIAIAILLNFAIDLLYPKIMGEIGGLRQRIQSIEQEIRPAATQVKDYIMQRVSFIDEEQLDSAIAELLGRFQIQVLNVSGSLLSFAQGILSLLIQIIMIPLIAFFILKDGPAIKKSVLNIVPNKFFEAALHLFYKTDQQIGRYIRGQILDNFILAVLYSIGFQMMGMPYFILFGAFSGIANIVPYVGPVIGIIPPLIVLIMETGSFSMIPTLIALFVAVQIFDVALIQPTVVAKSVHLHPLVIIFAVFAGGTLLGVVGMLFAVLLSGIIKVILSEIAWSNRNYRLWS